jgi:hypothetical protein
MPQYSLYKGLYDTQFIGASREYQGLIMSMIKPPFEENTENTFITHTYTCDKVPCLGLMAAMLNQSLSISFANTELWKKMAIEIKDDTGTAFNVDNVYESASFNDDKISGTVSLKMLSEIGDYYLETDSTPASEKKCPVRRDHGDTELKAFWSKLRMSPYIRAGNSMPSLNGAPFFQLDRYSHNTNVSRLCLSVDGVHRLSVQTTGRNSAETQYIGKLLEQKYSATRGRK